MIGIPDDELWRVIWPAPSRRGTSTMRVRVGLRHELERRTETSVGQAVYPMRSWPRCVLRVTSRYPEVDLGLGMGRSPIRAGESSAITTTILRAIFPE